MDQNNTNPQPMDEQWLDSLLAGDGPEAAQSEPVQEDNWVDLNQETPFRDAEFRDTFGEGEDLEEIFNQGRTLETQDQTLPEQPQEEEAPPIRKGRPQRKKGYGLLGIPHILATAVWLAIAVAVGVSLGRMLWLCAADVLAFGHKPVTATVVITEEDDIDAISQKLKDAGLIEYPQFFSFFATLTGKDAQIDPGTYEFNPYDETELEYGTTIYDYSALINSLQDYGSSQSTVTVVIPEGYTCAQIFSLLEQEGVCSVEDLEAYCDGGELSDYWFLEGVDRQGKYSLEGYLFPDTYEFYTNDRPRRVLEKFLNAFEAHFTERMQDKLVTLNEWFSSRMRSIGYGQDYIDAHQITVRDVVIVASMIEKETAGVVESFDISAVIYNRLANQASYPYLNIDATLIYALDGNVDPETGKTKPLTNADKELDSPYNTYLYKGLIPGPISNPGIASLNAAVDPNDNSYYYYAYNPYTYAHEFFTNYDDHLAFLNRIGEEE